MRTYGYRTRVKDRHYHLRKNFNPRWKNHFRIGSKIILHNSDSSCASSFDKMYGDYKVWTVCRYRNFGKSDKIDSFDCPKYKVTLKCHAVYGHAYDKFMLYAVASISNKPINMLKTVTMYDDYYVSSLEDMVKRGQVEVVEY